MKSALQFDDNRPKMLEPANLKKTDWSMIIESEKQEKKGDGKTGYSPTPGCMPLSEPEARLEAVPHAER